MGNEGVGFRPTFARMPSTSGELPSSGSTADLTETGEADTTQPDSTEGLPPNTQTAVASAKDAAAVKSRPLMPEGLADFLRIQRGIWLASLAVATFPLSIPLIMLAAHKGYFDAPQSNAPAAAGGGSSSNTSSASSQAASKSVVPPVEEGEQTDDDTGIVSYTQGDPTAAGIHAIATDEAAEARDKDEGQPESPASEKRQVDHKHASRSGPLPEPSGGTSKAKA